MINKFYYNVDNKDHPNNTVSHPLKIVILTSIRDIKSEDGVGNLIKIANNKSVYLPGTVEWLQSYINIKNKNWDIVGIITDDDKNNPRDLSKIENQGYIFTPDNNRPESWIFPECLRNQAGNLLVDKCLNIPSEYRRIRDKEEKKQQKLAFEEKIVSVAAELGANILLSDHLMVKLDKTIDLWNQRQKIYNYYNQDHPNGIGCVLNIHPAITRQDSGVALVGKTPTQDALKRSKYSDYAWTGATLHIISKIIDDGPPIVEIEHTPILENDNPHQLRFRNYVNSKLYAVLLGLEHYHENIYPFLNSISWTESSIVALNENLPQIKEQEFSLDSILTLGYNNHFVDPYPMLRDN